LVSYFAASYIFPGIVTAFERGAQKAGFHMIFNQSESELDKERLILKKLKEKGVGGIAIVPINAGLDGPGAPPDLGSTNYDLLRELADSGTPVLLVDNDFGDGRFPAIVLDDLAFGREAARYLAERGHRELGLAYAGGHRPYKLRKEGFEGELASIGIAEPTRVRVESVGEAEEALCEALGGPRPSAFFCANDEMAVALYRAAARRGLSIPGDLSVISVDNSDYAGLPGMGLTSIAHPSAFIGARAARMLIDGIAAPELRFREMTVIEPIVVERTSVRAIG
jgi:DNA-binding LacI/PurR family transcriptional regulator